LEIILQLIKDPSETRKFPKPENDETPPKYVVYVENILQETKT
jgi:hypothetical protein